MSLRGGIRATRQPAGESGGYCCRLSGSATSRSNAIAALTALDAGNAGDVAFDIAISLGDPAGIGPEIVVKALAANPDLDRRCCVYGSPAVIASTASALALPAPTHINVGNHFQECSQLAGILCDPGPPVVNGQETAAAGRQAYAAIVLATRAVQRGHARALVTAPVSKHAMHLAGHRWPGHTELLAHLAGDCPVRMMLANPELRVILVTVHLPLRQAIDAIDRSAIIDTIRIADRSLNRILGRRPRLLVAGLNPHAGEQGMLGREEIDLIGPAVTLAAQEGIDATGPWPPDTVFMRARGLTDCDAVIAMYHDQGLIPVKYLGVDSGVNVSLGLPFLRASPDHGTAFDIAGRGLARPDSLMAALRLVDDWQQANPAA